MNIVSQKIFNSYSKEEKESYVHHLAYLNYKLKEWELPYLKGKGREEYLEEKVNSGTWLDDYEFNVLPKKMKESYILKKKFLADDEVMRLSLDLKKFYIDNITSNKLSITDDAIDMLPEKLKKYYVSNRLKYSKAINLRPKEVYHLDEKEQIKYIEHFLGPGFSIRPEVLKILKPSARKEYNKKKNIQESVRIFIKNTIKNVLN